MDSKGTEDETCNKEQLVKVKVECQKEMEPVIEFDGNLEKAIIGGERNENAATNSKNNNFTNTNLITKQKLIVETSSIEYDCDANKSDDQKQHELVKVKVEIIDDDEIDTNCENDLEFGEISTNYSNQIANNQSLTCNFSEGAGENEQGLVRVKVEIMEQDDEYEAEFEHQNSNTNYAQNTGLNSNSIHQNTAEESSRIIGLNSNSTSNLSAEESNNKCLTCKRTFKTPAGLKKHDCCVCEICKKTFITRRNLENHMRSHTKEKPHRCDECQKSFSHKLSLKEHVQLVHSQHAEGESSSLRHACLQCGKQFLRNYSLMEHLKLHAAEKGHKCDFCFKEFAQRGTLTKHLKLHTASEQKIWVCEVCGKGLGSPSHLRVHQRVHSGERPYGCQLCEKKFGHVSNLRNHIKKVHEKNKNPPTETVVAKNEDSTTADDNLATTSVTSEPAPFV